MTEQEWSISTDPVEMLNFVRGKVSNRKLRLFSVACLRRIWHLIEDTRLKDCVEMVERFAEGLSPQAGLSEAHSVIMDYNRALANGHPNPVRAVLTASHAVRWATQESEDAFNVVRACVSNCQGAVSQDNSEPTENCAQAVLLREIVGPGASGLASFNPAWPTSTVQPRFGGIYTGNAIDRLLALSIGSAFRAIAVDSAWRTPNVRNLAESVYTHGAFDRLPILANALEDAGCTDADILNHCRQSGEHVRGCWVVDLLLDKN